MNQEILGKLKNKVGICKDFFSSFKRLPGPLQEIVIKRILSLIDEISDAPTKAMNYDRDLPSKRKYFPNTAEILESGEFFPFRSVRLPKNEENNDAVAINFVSGYLVNKLGLVQIIGNHFCVLPGGLTNDKICLVSCSYYSFESIE